MEGAPPLLASQSHAEHDLRDLRALLVSEDVNEVVINPDGAVWVERADAEHMVRTEHRFPPGKVLRKRRLRPTGFQLDGLKFQGSRSSMADWG